MPWTRCLGFAFMAAATLAAAWAAAWAVAAQGELQRRVIVVQSYNPEYIWCREIDAGIREALAETGATIETLYLDAKRRPDPASLRDAADRALARITALAPQVVIAVDDAAQASLIVPFLKDRPSPPGGLLRGQRPLDDLRVSSPERHRGARAIPLPRGLRPDQKDRAPGQKRRHFR